MTGPDVTTIVPTYGRPAGLRACLEGLASLAGDHLLEVIVVDDGGPAGAAEVVAGFRDQLPIRLLRTERGGPGSARNAGAAAAHGRFLAFIDDDCVPGRDWLCELRGALESFPTALAGGQVRNMLPANPYASASQSISTFVYAWYAVGRGRERFFTTNNFALEREAFLELGGFDTTIPSRTAEDKEFCDRWTAAGRTMRWVPDAIVRHAHDLTLWRFVRQHYNYGRGILYFRLMRRRRGGRHLIPEGPSFYLGLLSHPLRHERWPRAWQQTALLLVSQAATAVGAARAALFDRRRRSPSAESGSKRSRGPR